MWRRDKPDLVGAGTHAPAHLGREHDLVTAARNRLADQLLGLAGGVDVGGVDEIDPGVEGAMDDARRRAV